MATMMASMNVAGVQALDVVSTSSQLKMRSASRLGGLRLNVVNHSSVALSSSPARSIVVVRAGEGVTDKVKKAAGAAKGKIEQAGDYLSGKADEAHDSAKHASRDARGEAEHLGGKAQTAFEESGDSLKRNTEKTTSSELRKDVGKDMKGKINWNRAQLAYVIVYVPDVNKAAEFYNKAFGLAIRPQNKSNSWVEMETGATTLAFTPMKQHESELTGGVSSSGNNSIVINLDFENVEAAYKHAIAQGATSVADPEDKSWPQKVGYVKDIDGNIVRLGSFPAM